jgi:hypothetical protein
MPFPFIPPDIQTRFDGRKAGRKYDWLCRHEVGPYHHENSGYLLLCEIGNKTVEEFLDICGGDEPSYRLALKMFGISHSRFWEKILGQEVEARMNSEREFLRGFIEGVIERSKEARRLAETLYTMMAIAKGATSITWTNAPDEPRQGDVRPVFTNAPSTTE